VGSWLGQPINQLYTVRLRRIAKKQECSNVVPQEIPAGAVLGFSLAIALVSWRFLIGGAEVTMQHVTYHAVERQLAFYAHVGLAPVSLMLMPFQFWTGLRAKRPGLHHWLGRVYAGAILLSGLGGLAMAIGTKAGAVAGAGFGLLAVLWLGTTGYAVWLAIQRDITAHRRWMIRSAALTFAAVTLRLYLPLLAVGFGFEAGYTMVAWLS
jgi:uncharacterized membrane protein YozB (DUF420 family)